MSTNTSHNNPVTVLWIWLIFKLICWLPIMPLIWGEEFAESGETLDASSAVITFLILALAEALLVRWYLRRAKGMTPEWRPPFHPGAYIAMYIGAWVAMYFVWALLTTGNVLVDFILRTIVLLGVIVFQLIMIIRIRDARECRRRSYAT